ncbi:cysteine hydrolase family protein [Alkalicoccus urumqiensis]|nr:cysteine hydrolase family protein [Alkalicoccus urumqiensis]
MNSALIVIDVQEGLVQAGPYEKDRVLQTVSGLIEQARQQQVPIVFVRHADEPGGLLEPESAAWEFYRSISPEEADTVIEKTHNSAFYQTNLQEELERLGATRVVLCGLQTEYCVDATCKSAFERGFDVVVVQDGHSTLGEGPVSAEKLKELYGETIWPGRFAEVVKTLERF